MAEGGQDRSRMKVGLIDVDGHNFPNLALMRLSAYHKGRGDEVGWYEPPLYGTWYDVVYMSKIFSDAYTAGIDEPMNADKVVKGGTGYCISLDANGREVFDKGKDVLLPPEVEKCFPDYSIYPQYGYAVAMTSRGCPRGCGFCHVAAKEGRCSVKVADVSDFWTPELGKDEIRVLDPNLTACREKRGLMRQYKETGAMIDFTQGLDIRLIDEYDIEDLNEMRLRSIHFAWDNAKEDLEGRFREFAKGFRRKWNGMVYVLTNYNSTMEENLHRIYTLRDLGYTPFVMVYNRPSATKEILDLQFWCNSKLIFKGCKFEDFSYANYISLMKGRFEDRDKYEQEMLY